MIIKGFFTIIIISRYLYTTVYITPPTRMHHSSSHQITLRSSLGAAHGAGEFFDDNALPTRAGLYYIKTVQIVLEIDTRDLFETHVEVKDEVGGVKNIAIPQQVIKIGDFLYFLAFYRLMEVQYVGENIAIVKTGNFDFGISGALTSLIERTSYTKNTTYWIGFTEKSMTMLLNFKAFDSHSGTYITLLTKHVKVGEPVIITRTELQSTRCYAVERPRSKIAYKIDMYHRSNCAAPFSGYDHSRVSFTFEIIHTINNLQQLKNTNPLSITGN